MGNIIKVRAEELRPGDFLVDGDHVLPVLGASEGGETHVVLYQPVDGRVRQREYPNAEMVEVVTR